MPDTVPVHFGTGGEADDRGSKSTILWLSLIMLACIGGCHRLSSRSTLSSTSYPVWSCSSAAPLCHTRPSSWMNQPAPILVPGADKVPVSTQSSGVKASSRPGKGLLGSRHRSGRVHASRTSRVPPGPCRDSGAFI
ncbi:DUF1648 domain-containing protein [Corynebacterium sp.]|uniref:DUF1648 domain-containing protein n=1 Tax=Corynebacterium sp. TaxID=1720 RepID=UPI0025C72FAE|nr:DUF1648 domain-containing protein [Corynebacterium sp.]